MIAGGGVNVGQQSDKAEKSLLLKNMCRHLAWNDHKPAPKALLGLPISQSQLQVTLPSL